ncbi:MAG: YcxB family protein [Lachnospiraceae bacterium]|nr:YcxB family protein [Lachnospiraceae bacterium]
MEAIFTAKTTYGENLFYHRAIAKKYDKAVAKKKSALGDLEILDLFMSVVAFGLYYFATSGMDMPTRIFQSLLAVILFTTIIRNLNRMRRRSDESNMSETALKRNAKSDLAATGQEGETCTVTFGAESMLIESPGIMTEIRYEGLERLKETEEYFMLFRSQLTIIPVEKAGIIDAAPEELAAFLEEKSGKKMEPVRKTA